MDLFNFIISSVPLIFEIHNVAVYSYIRVETSYRSSRKLKVSFSDLQPGTIYAFNNLVEAHFLVYTAYLQPDLVLGRLVGSTSHSHSKDSWSIYMCRCISSFLQLGCHFCKKFMIDDPNLV